jgi:hypothetical protein
MNNVHTTLAKALATASEVAALAKSQNDVLIQLLLEAPCTCPNPEPHDWPHDPANEQCYKAQVDAVLIRIGVR